MYRKEVNERSPLRVLENSIHGGLGPGNLGVVMSRAGAGGTAFLTQVGLDELMRERGVLHVALGDSLDHTLSWYEALYTELARVTELEERAATLMGISNGRIIQSFADHHLTAERLERIIDLYAEHADFAPKALLIDDWSWSGSTVSLAANLGAFKSIARRLGAELWMTARTHRASTGAHPTGIVPPCEALAELIDVALFLEPEGDHVNVRLLKDHGDANPPDTTHLRLDCDTLMLAREDEERSNMTPSPRGFTLLSGGAKGAENEFGKQAERHGLKEMTFSFEGRESLRRRGLVELTVTELHEGDVSEAYLDAQLHRSLPRTPTFRKILATIWHQVATAGEVFVIGSILEDGSVKGGTGWAAELAHHMHKPVYVFDQEKKKWHNRTASGWTEIEPPTITRVRFAGTGTRMLSDAGRSAISDLYTRSFGAPEVR